MENQMKYFPSIAPTPGSTLPDTEWEITLGFGCAETQVKEHSIRGSWSLRLDLFGLWYDEGARRGPVHLATAWVIFRAS